MVPPISAVRITAPSKAAQLSVCLILFGAVAFYCFQKSEEPLSSLVNRTTVLGAGLLLGGGALIAFTCKPNINERLGLNGLDGSALLEKLRDHQNERIDFSRLPIGTIPLSELSSGLKKGDEFEIKIFDHLPQDQQNSMIDRLKPVEAFTVLSRLSNRKSRLAGYQRVAEKEPNLFGNPFNDIKDSPAYPGLLEYYRHLNQSPEGQELLTQWLDQSFKPICDQQVRVIIEVLGDDRARAYYQQSIQKRFPRWIEQIKAMHSSLTGSVENSFKGRAAFEQLCQAARLGTLSEKQIDQAKAALSERQLRCFTSIVHPEANLLIRY